MTHWARNFRFPGFFLTRWQNPNTWASCWIYTSPYMLLLRFILVLFHRIYLRILSRLFLSVFSTNLYMHFRLPPPPSMRALCLCRMILLDLVTVVFTRCFVASRCCLSCSPRKHLQSTFFPRIERQRHIIMPYINDCRAFWILGVK
jgi:hypothetical protein